MGTNRMEAFSDGVIAIIVTIMVLEFKPPRGAGWSDAWQLAPSLWSYALSFVVAAIMWVNHHHLVHIVRHVDARLLWANNNLLFWMSLIPFVTSYMAQYSQAPIPVAMYGVVLTMCSASFYLLRKAITSRLLHNEELTRENNRALHKNTLATVLYASTLPLAFASVYFSYAIFVIIPAMYFFPERKLAEHTAAA